MTEPVQQQRPYVNADGTLTYEGYALFEEMQRRIDDLEQRVEALENP